MANEPRAGAAGKLKPRRFLAMGMVLWLAVVLSPIAPRAETKIGDLREGFLSPANEARPWVFWFWINGNVTTEGITADLESMRKVGLAGAIIMDVSQEVPNGPVRFFSPEWRRCFKHAVQEAKRLGLMLGIHNAPGYCGSGGPWVTEQLGMQQFVYAKTNIVGPGRFVGLLPALNRGERTTRDAGVIAYPSIAGEGGLSPGYPPQVRVPLNARGDGRDLVDHDRSTYVELDTKRSRDSRLVELVFKEEIKAARLELTVIGIPTNLQCELSVAKDGRTYSKIREVAVRGTETTILFAETTGRFFRMEFKGENQKLKLAEVELSPVFRIPEHNTKAGLGRERPEGAVARARVPPEGIVRPGEVIDLTKQAGTNGLLTWEVPKGNWTVLRFGYMPTGRKNHPAQPEATGLEIDKLSQDAVEAHIGAFAGELIRDAGPEAGRTLTWLHVDSWEVGFQNWTGRFREDFRERRGYDLLPWLPAMTGTYVGDPSLSERFLWDVRRTISELVASNYAGHMAKVVGQQGLKLSIQGYGQGPFSSLDYAGQADMPMAEFWVDEDDYDYWHYPKLMASAAHTYNRRVVPAEAFTAWPKSGKWQEHPGALKAQGDSIFCLGVNQFVFHRYAHQPWLGKAPGMTMGQWGVHYERTATWWEYSRPWHDYLARCQFLLQQGGFRADVCYLAPEGGYVDPPGLKHLSPPLPSGYDYDLVSPAEAVRSMRVADGEVLLTGETRYKVLVLSPSDRMTVELLTKVRALVEAGATVLGPKPTGTPTMENYPAAEDELRRMAAELWGKCDGKTVLENRYGRGRMVWGKPLDQVLREAGTTRDFSPAKNAPPLRWIHRRASGTEIYFVCNSYETNVIGDYVFRVSGRQPELWDAESGKIRLADAWRENGDGTEVRLGLGPAESVFVIFESTPGQTSSRKAAGSRFANPVQAARVNGPWDVEFRPNSPEQGFRHRLPELISWAEDANPQVKFFSGTAIYRKDVEVPMDWLGTNQSVQIDLGRVAVIATVQVNGGGEAILWKPPYQTDVTQWLRAGKNELLIKVVNLWPNRLIGDELLHEDGRWKQPDGDNGVGLVDWPSFFREGKADPSGRSTFTTWKHWRKDSRLLESGLLGPVNLQLFNQ